jgi:hypothetical protein
MPSARCRIRPSTNPILPGQRHFFHANDQPGLISRESPRLVLYQAQRCPTAPGSATCAVSGPRGALPSEQQPVRSRQMTRGLSPRTPTTRVLGCLGNPRVLPVRVGSSVSCGPGAMISHGHHRRDARQLPEGRACSTEISRRAVGMVIPFPAPPHARAGDDRSRAKSFKP